MIRGRTIPVFTGQTRYIWSARSRGFAVFSGPSGGRIEEEASRAPCPRDEVLRMVGLPPESIRMCFRMLG
jgi:hypothetical protein